MKAQASTTLGKYIGIILEGLLELVWAIIISVVAIAFIKALSGINGSSQSIALIAGSITLVFLVSLVINFAKGFYASGEALASIIGMAGGLYLFSGSIGSLAPDAVVEVIFYIVAAIFGVILGAWWRSNRN